MQKFGFFSEKNLEIRELKKRSRLRLLIVFENDR